MSANSKGGTNKQHKQSLIDQGFIKEEEKKECPRGLEYLFATYKEIRFSRINTNSLLPRDSLSFSDINQYQQTMQFKLSPTECDVIMRIDAIYNKSTG